MSLPDRLNTGNGNEEARRKHSNKDCAAYDQLYIVNA